MLSVALTLLLATWAASAVRYSVAIRNADTGLAAMPLMALEPERLAA